MNKVKLFCVLFLLFLIERVFFARFQVFGITPWLVYAFLLAFSAVSKDFFSVVITAAVMGAFADLTGGGAVGSALAVFALSAALINFLTSRVLKSNFIISGVLIFAVGILGEMLYFMLNRKGVIDFSYGEIFVNIALLLSVLNTLFAVLFYPLAKRLVKGGNAA